MISILQAGSLRSPPPIRLRRTSPCSGGRIGRSMLSCRDMVAPWLSIHSAPACGGKVVAPATKGGTAGVVREVYDSLFFPSYLSFPLEGKSREAGKGVRGRAPIGCSIAVLTANRRPPERSDAQNVVSRFPFRGDEYYNAAFRRSRPHRVS